MSYLWSIFFIAQGIQNNTFSMYNCIGGESKKNDGRTILKSKILLWMFRAHFINEQLLLNVIHLNTRDPFYLSF